MKMTIKNFKLRKLITLGFFSFLLFSGSILYAQMPAELANKPKGILNGKLTHKMSNNEIKVLSDHKVAMMVFFQGQRILLLDKSTDKEGKFSFSNIFQDPDYKYALGAVVDGKLYVYPKIGLELGQDKIEVNFEVGENSSYYVDEKKVAAQLAKAQSQSNMSQNQMSGEMQIQPTIYLSSNQAQYMSLALGAMVVLLGIYFAFIKGQSST